MTLQRLRVSDEVDEQPPQVTVNELMDNWLNDLAAEREWLLMRLRQVEPVLVQHGRLRQETPRRVR